MMKKEYLKLFMDVIQYQEEDIVRTSSPSFGADEDDDYGYDFWD